MTRPLSLLIALLAIGIASAQASAQAPAPAPTTANPASAAGAPAKAEVYIISPRNGATLHGAFTVRFGLKGAGIAPAGVKFDNTGHHHLLIDTPLSGLSLDAPLPTTDKVLHFGKGQTETTLTLPPGRHTLQLLFADYAHVPLHPLVASRVVTITVQ